MILAKVQEELSGVLLKFKPNTNMRNTIAADIKILGFFSRLFDKPKFHVLLFES